MVSPEGLDSGSVGPGVGFSDESTKSNALPSYEAGWVNGTAKTSSVECHFCRGIPFCQRTRRSSRVIGGLVEGLYLGVNVGCVILHLLG